MKLVLSMYNAHPYFSLKNLGKHVHYTWQDMVPIKALLIHFRLADLYFFTALVRRTELPVTLLLVHFSGEKTEALEAKVSDGAGL